jgi:hypothetical protein
MLGADVQLGRHLAAQCDAPCRCRRSSLKLTLPTSSPSRRFSPTRFI